MDEVEARELAGRELDSDALVIAGATRVSKTWVVFQGTRAYAESGELEDSAPGLGPILVADDGRVMRTGSSPRKKLDQWVAEF
jgi:hypothetical protein